MAGATRIELATSGVTGRRSNQAELRPRISLECEKFDTLFVMLNQAFF